MKNTLGVLLIFLMSIQCSDTRECCVGPEQCIQQVITAIQNEPVRNPPAKVFRMLFQGETYYYVPSYCCDQYGMLYDSQCNLICHPDGGISGNGDGNCPDIDLTKGELIWEDTRPN